MNPSPSLNFLTRSRRLFVGLMIPGLSSAMALVSPRPTAAQDAISGAEPAQSESQATVDNALVSAIGLLPHQKKSIGVPADEPNPFAVVTASVEKNEAFEDATVQEAKIRQFFSTISIGGISRKGDVSRVMIGGMILAEGDRVPQVLPNQTERLEVVTIDDDKIELAWVDDDQRTNRSAIARTLTIPLNPLKARVRSGLPGGVAGGDIAGADGYLYREQGDLQLELRTPPKAEEPIEE